MLRERRALEGQEDFLEAKNHNKIQLYFIFQQLHFIYNWNFSPNIALRKSSATMQQDQFQMLQPGMIGSETENTIGLRLLDLYLSFFVIKGDVFAIREWIGVLKKHALRLCCKRLKALVDGTKTSLCIQLDRAYEENPQIGQELRSGNNNTAVRLQPKAFRNFGLLAQTFPSLTTLHVRYDNAITRIDESIGALTSLTNLELRLDGDSETALPLPSSVSQLISLKRLNVRFMGNIAPLRHCTALEELSMVLVTKEECDKLPDLLDNMPLLSFLDLDVRGEKRACSIPDNIGSLKRLKKLVINDIRLLLFHPDIFLGMQSLTYLYFVDIEEGFSDLPASFGCGLTRLEELRFSSCYDLKSFPDSFCNLKELTGLYIYECDKILKLPSCLGDLPSLTDLSIYECKSLTTLPSSLTRSTSLIYVFIGQCMQLMMRDIDIEELTERFGETFVYIPFSTDW
jgi:hypothetical protein